MNLKCCDTSILIIQFTRTTTTTTTIEMGFDIIEINLV